MEKEVPIKTVRCKCGSTQPDDSIAKHCRNKHCPCAKRGEPCIPPFCLCKCCQNTANPDGWLVPLEHRPVAVTVDDETKTVAEVHPALVAFAKKHRFAHLHGTTGQDDELRKRLNEIDYKAGSCPQCGRLESTFLTWVAAHVTDLSTGEHYLIRTCSSCNGKGKKKSAAEFVVKRKTFGLLIDKKSGTHEK